MTVAGWSCRPATPRRARGRRSGTVRTMLLECSCSHACTRAAPACLSSWSARGRQQSPSALHRRLGFSFIYSLGCPIRLNSIRWKQSDSISPARSIRPSLFSPRDCDCDCECTCACVPPPTPSPACCRPGRHVLHGQHGSGVRQLRTGGLAGGVLQVEP